MEFYRLKVEARQWKAGRDLVNNLLRRFKTICKNAGVGPFSIHDLRRSCITNFARSLPIHVVQQLAGHSDITTTQEYYLSVQPEDLRKAKSIQQKLLGPLAETIATDQLLTNSGKNRDFSRRKIFPGLPQPFEK